MKIETIDGWRRWDAIHRPGDDSPYMHKKIEVAREEWDSPAVQGPYDNPMGNAVGLYWRPISK